MKNTLILFAIAAVLFLSAELAAKGPKDKDTSAAGKGPTVKAEKQASKSDTDAAQAKTEKAEKAGKPDRTEKAEKAETAERPEKPQEAKTGKPDDAEKGKGKEHAQQLAAKQKQIEHEQAKHLERKARLERLLELAQNKGDEKTVARIKSLMEKEQGRYGKKLGKTTEKADSIPAKKPADTTTAPQPTEQPAEPSAEKPAEQPAEQPAAQ